MSQITKMLRRLQGHSAENMTYDSLDLRNMSAFQSKWSGCKFIGCRAGLADVQASFFIDTEFVGCDLRMTNFRGTVIENTTFTGCELDQACFVGAILRNVKFVDCRMPLVNFSGATLRMACQFIECNLYGSDLDFIEAGGQEFRDCNLWGAKMANNCQFWNSKIDEKTCRMFIAMIARIYPGAEKEALVLLAGKEYTLVDRLMGEMEVADVQ